MLRACVLDLGGSWDVHLPLVEFSYNNSYHSSMRCAPFDALYETTEKISQIKDGLKATRNRQKSYDDKRRIPLEFSVGEYVFLKVSHWKGVVRCGKKEKLAPRFFGPFEITKRIGLVAYRLRLPEELNGVHDTFHVSNLKKCLADPTLKLGYSLPLVEISYNDSYHASVRCAPFKALYGRKCRSPIMWAEAGEEHVEILEREFKKLKRSRIAIVKAKYGRANCEPSYRVMVRPFLNTRRSHLQRDLGNEKVLIVQFTDDLDPDMPFDQQSWIATHQNTFDKNSIDDLDPDMPFDQQSWIATQQNTSDKNSIGFRITWRTWIKACLKSSPTLILVNGSLTSEFNVRRGLRQTGPLGIPCLLFLFIIIIEGLHVAISDSNSHDVENIIRIFKVFFLNLVLKINIRKSSIYGVGVPPEEMHHMASNTGCSAGSFPITYLGLSIGSNTSLTVNRKLLVDKFHSKLSSWKASLLSYGGRLTLLKTVLGSLGIYYVSLFKVPSTILNYLENLRASFFWGGHVAFEFRSVPALF
nr:putative reverse transcriptase domain-containing protein [Tanacetum cinerariifolium]